ncbi:MAG: proteasome assembly chaperone family protein [Candidatus Aenigmatarchaeota archaeon]
MVKMNEINYLETPKLKNPILIEGLPGIGNVGRISAGYMIEQLKAKKFAELYSDEFLPFVVLQKNGLAKLLKSEFYYYKGKQDLIILVGDSQAITPQGYYKLCNTILDLAEKFKVNEIITLGGLGTDKLSKTPRIVGAVNDERLIKKYKDFGIIFDGTLVGTIVGVSGLLIGMSKTRNIDAICLLVETSGFPVVVADPIGAEAILKMLMKILDLKIDLTMLERDAKELEKKIIKTEEIHKKMISRLMAMEKGEEEVGYIR